MRRKGNGAFTVTGTREIFRGRVFTVVNRDVTLPNGRQTTFHIIEHPGACAIVPICENGDVLLLRQLRVATGEELFEIPAGTLEPDESPLETAKREIVEETGFKARSWKKLLEFYTAPGFCTELMHLFVARGLFPATAEKDADEVIRVQRVSRRKAMEMIRKGLVRDAKSIVGLLLTENL